MLRTKMFTICTIFFLYFSFEYILIELINIILLIDFILIGGIYPLLERKFLALMQRRVGPKYTGYKGRLQFIADALKIFFKDYFFLFRNNKYVFYIIPVLFFNFNMFVMCNLVWGNSVYLIDIELNILYILVLSAVSNFAIFLTSYFSRNKYSIIAGSRIVSVFFINELILTILICQYLFWSNSFSFSAYTILQAEYYGIYYFLFHLPSLIYVFMLDVSRVPFDYAEAESELVMGYTNEYTGFLFGVYTLIEYIHIFAFSYFLVLLLWW